MIIGPGITIGSGFKYTPYVPPPPPIPLGSVLFNGSNNNLKATLSNQLGTNNFTIEFWIYFTAWFDNGLASSISNMFDTRINSVDGVGLALNINSTNLRFRVGGTNIDSANRGDMSLNTWTHLAVVRNGNVFTTYVNGTSKSSATVTLNTTRTALTIGQSYDSYNLNAYISNFRIVNGVAVYTGNFTPATNILTSTQSSNINGSPSAAITGTQTALLLTTPNNSDYLVDSSSYNLSVTNTNSVASSSLTPF